MCENEWCDLFLSLSLSLERERERGGTLVKTLASKRRKALLWSSVLRRASSEAFAVERGCKNNASKGQNEMREFLQKPTNNTESKKKKESKRESKREYFREEKNASIKSIADAKEEEEERRSSPDHRLLLFVLLLPLSPFPPPLFRVRLLLPVVFLLGLLCLPLSPLPA